MSIITLKRPPHQKPLLGTSIDWSHPLSKGLIGSWMMNEGAGNRVYDSSGNHNHGLIVGAKWVSNGLLFDGVDGNDWIQIPESSSLDIYGANSAITAFAIVTCYDWSGDGGGVYPFSKRDGANNQYGWFINATDNTTYSWGADPYIRSTRSLPVFRQIALGTGMGVLTGQHYVDGIPEVMADSTVSAMTHAASDIFIGARGDGAGSTIYNFYGIISYLVLWNRKLIPEEHNSLNADPYQMFQQPRVYSSIAAGLSINIFETLDTVESIGPNMPLAGVSKSELINIVENIVNRISIKNLSFETITVQELAQALIEVAPSVFEQMTVTEFVSMLIETDGISVSDQITIAESTAILMNLAGIDIAEPITVNEFVSMLVKLAVVTVDDQINVTESIAASMELAGIDASESITVNEFISMTINLAVINVFENITLTEYVSMQIEGMDLTLTGQEIINISEYVVAQLPLLADQSDSVTIAESIAMHLLLSQNQFESMTIAEVVDLILPLTQSVDDSITVNDFASVVTEQLLIFYENLTVSEYVSVSVASIVSIVGLLTVDWSAKKPGFDWSAKKPRFIITNT